MSLTLFIGEANSGKTTRLLEEFFKNNAYKKGVYVTPNQSLSLEYKEHFLRNYAKATIGDRFVSWDLFVKLMCPNDIRIDTFGSAIFISQLMNPEKLSYFKLRTTYSIAYQIARTIHDLKRNLITPEILEEILKDRGGLKEYDLLRLFHAYEDLLAQKNVKDTGSITAEAIVSINAKNRFLNDVDIIIFDEFTRTDFEFINIIKSIKTSYPLTKIFLSAARKSKELIEIADEIVEMQNTFESTASIIPISLRSPKAQIEFIAQQLSNSLESKETCKIVIKEPSQITKRLYKELNIFENDRWTNTITSTLFKKKHEIELPDLAHPAEFVAKTKKFLDPRVPTSPRLRWARKHEDDISSCGIDGEIKTSRTIADIAEILDRLLIGESILKTKISKQTYLEFLRKSLQAIVKQEQQKLGGRFVIRRFNDGAGLAVDQTIIPDCVDDNYPKTVQKTMFFSEHDSLTFAPHPILDQIFPNKEFLIGEEIESFKNFAAKCRGELFLTYPLFNNLGKETSPSLFMNKMERIVLDKKTCANSASSSIRANIEIKRLSNQDSQNEFNGKITNKKMLEDLNKRFSKANFSASSLESYAECHFKFFIETVLNIEPVEEITPDIQANHFGTIIHDALQNIFKEDPDFLKSWNEDKEASLKKVKNYTTASFEKNSDLIKYASPPIIELRKSSAARMIEHFIDSYSQSNTNVQSPLTPAFFEWSFGNVERFEIEMDDGTKARFTGKVDRIDIAKDKSSFIIVDYKTGKTSSVISRIENGEHLQLPIYITAVKNILLKPQQPLGGVLLSLRNTDTTHGMLLKDYNKLNYFISPRSKSLVTEEKFNALMDKAFEYVRKYISAIKNGEFSPSGENCKKNCRYAEICRCTER